MQGERPYAGEEARERAFRELRGIAIAMARRSQVPGCEFGDILSELMLHLWHVVLPDYEPGRSPLPGFVRCRLRRHLCCLLRREYRFKRLTRLTHTGADEVLWESLVDTDLPVDEVVLSRLHAANVAPLLLRHLTPLERQVAETLATGCDTHEAAAALGVRYKAVDNALYRVRRKLKEIER